MKEKTCCFTGHRDIPADAYQLIFNKTEEMVENLIKKGYLYFGAGGALGFDTIAAFVVLKLKERYPDVRLILVLPCLAQTRGCMHKRNRHLVDNSSACICYLTKDSGGTAYTVEYARNKGLLVKNIA